MVNYSPIIALAQCLRSWFSDNAGRRARRFYFSLFTLSLCSLCANAQTTFTQHLTRQLAGEGKVTLHHDAEIESLVNGQTRLVNNTRSAANRNQEQAQQPDSLSNGESQLTGRRAMSMGYRIQVYAGGNNRRAKQDAQQMANIVKSYFSNVSVYANFISPRWVCRVGDFKTYEEAKEMLERMRETHRFNEASIVKTQIVVYR